MTSRECELGQKDACEVMKLFGNIQIHRMSELTITCDKEEIQSVLGKLAHVNQND